VINNKPFFRNISNIGDLYLYYIIFEYECPILFVCKNKQEDLYLCVCYDIRDSQRWIVAPIDERSIIDLLTNRLTIRDAFAVYQCKTKRVLVEWKNEYKDYYHSKKVSFEEIPDEYLPTEGEFVEAEEGEYQDFIILLEKRIKEKLLSKTQDSFIVFSTIKCMVTQESNKCHSILYYNTEDAIAKSYSPYVKSNVDYIIKSYQDKVQQIGYWNNNNCRNNGSEYQFGPFNFKKKGGLNYGI